MNIFYSDIPDISDVYKMNIVAMLPNPRLINKYYEFVTNLDNYDLK